MTNPAPPIDMKMIEREQARQEPLIRALTEAMTELVKDSEGPVIASALFDMVFTLAAAQPVSREPLMVRMHRLIKTIELMPDGPLAIADLPEFSRMVSATLGRPTVNPKPSPQLIVPPYLKRH